jgi:hypothetical protein
MLILYYTLLYIGKGVLCDLHESVQSPLLSLPPNVRPNDKLRLVLGPPLSSLSLSRTSNCSTQRIDYQGIICHNLSQRLF